MGKRKKKKQIDWAKKQSQKKEAIKKHQEQLKEKHQEEKKKQQKTTSIKKEKFLLMYSQNGNISRSAQIVGIDRTSHYRWMKDDPNYYEAFTEAQGQFADNLEAEAIRRAYEGVEQPIYYQGEEVGQVRKYSDTLLIFLLKGSKPEKYKERIEQETTHNGGFVFDFNNFSIEDLERIADIKVDDNE